MPPILGVAFSLHSNESLYCYYRLQCLLSGSYYYLIDALQDPEFATKVVTLTGMYVYVLYVRYVESSPKMCFVFFCASTKKAHEHKTSTKKAQTNTKLTQTSTKLAQN